VEKQGLGDGIREAAAEQQRKKQIPRGNDRKKSKSDYGADGGGEP
jgi:hypothetical protein